MTISALNSDATCTARLSGNPARAPAVPVQEVKSECALPLSVSCHCCMLKKYCPGSRLSGLAGDQPSSVVAFNQTFGKREHLFHAGDRTEALYIIKCGSAKLYFVSEDGREQVVNFYMPGEVLGLDALGNGTHRTSAVVLERTTFCVIPLSCLDRVPGSHHCLYELLSMELVRDQGIIGLVMKKDAETKMAKFLIDLSRRYRDRGYSATRFNLKMKRGEIGSHLGIATETVSRMLSRFQELGLLEVERCYIRICNFQELEKLSECPSSPHRALHCRTAG